MPVAKKEREKGGREGVGKEGREVGRRRSREYNSQQRAVGMMGSCGGLQGPCKSLYLQYPLFECVTVVTSVLP